MIGNKQYFNEIKTEFINTEKFFIELCESVISIQTNNLALKKYIFPPLQHLEIEPTSKKPDLEIFIVDNSFSKIDAPQSLFPDYSSLKISENKNTLDGETVFLNSEAIQVAFMPSKGELSAYHKNEKQAVFWVESEESLIPFSGRPLRSILQWFLGDKGFQIVHAAGVGYEDGGVIITGISGAGKSTTAVACLNSDLGFSGDENMILSTEFPYPAYSLYTSVNLNEKSLSFLPFLKGIHPSVIPGDVEKRMFFLNKSFSEKILNSFPIKAIIVSQVLGEGDCKLTPVSKITAMTALAPTSIFQIPGNKGMALKRMSKIVKDIPCYQLTVGKSLEDVPLIINELLGKI